MPVEPLDPVDLDLAGEEVVGLVDPVDLDLVGLTARRGKKGVLVQVQGEVWDLTAGRLLQILLGGGTMHLRKGE